MLAVFRRYTFRLNEETGSRALFSVLGGSPTCFHVAAASERHFRFSVASKAVGLLVLELRRVITSFFDIYFHIWRDGGSDWQKEHLAWQKEEEEQWTLVTRKKKKHHAKRVSFASPEHTRSSSPDSVGLSVRFGAFSCSVIPDHPSSSSSSSGKASVTSFQGKFFQKQSATLATQSFASAQSKARHRPHIFGNADSRQRPQSSKARSTRPCNRQQIAPKDLEAARGVMT